MSNKHEMADFFCILNSSLGVELVPLFVTVGILLLYHMISQTTEDWPALEISCWSQFALVLFWLTVCSLDALFFFSFYWAKLV